MNPPPLVEDAQNFAQNIVDTVREPLLMLDPKLRVRSANRAFYQTFQVTSKETEGQPIYELGNGQWDIPVLAMEDVTERRRIHDLEIRFTEGLQESYKRLQEVEQLRDDLKNMIVHDLRTPLTSVITGMRTLEMIGDLDSLQREMVGIAIRGGELLLGMINDLLEVEKMESGSMRLEYAELNAAELAASAASQVVSIAAGEKLFLVQSIDAGLPVFSADEKKLRRVLVNLLGDAIKFTPAGGTITLAAKLCDDTQALLFSVSDTGEGIPAEDFEHIFEKFGQVASRHAGRTMSTGLGLTFCKLAVEAHGGSIAVDSVPTEGSIFYFNIPLLRTSA